MSAFGRKHEAAITALMTHSTMTEAATAAGIGERTLRRWLQDPGFLTAYREARRQAVDTALAQLQSLCAEAVQALRNNLAPRGPSSVAAARAILEHATGAVELADVFERLEALEACVAGGAGSPQALSRVA